MSQHVPGDSRNFFVLCSLATSFLNHKSVSLNWLLAFRSLERFLGSEIQPIPDPSLREHSVYPDSLSPAVEGGDNK
jgi:hypothetical protein